MQRTQHCIGEKEKFKRNNKSHHAGNQHEANIDIVYTGNIHGYKGTLSCALQPIIHERMAGKNAVGMIQGGWVFDID